MTNQEQKLIKQGFEFSHQDTATQTARGSNSRIHYTKDLGFITLEQWREQQINKILI